MKELKISSFPPNKDFKNFKNIALNRQKIIDKTTDTQTNTNYQMNLIASNIYPDSITLIIKNIVNEVDNTKTYYLANANGNKLPIFKPGQYITLIFNINNMFLSRPYFLSSSPNDAINNVYRISVKNNTNGIVSNYMNNNLKINDILNSLPADGEFNLSAIRDKKQIVGICTSIGICPMISFARAIYEKNIDKLLTIFYLVKDQNNILYKKELDELAKNQDIKIVYVNKSNNEKIDISLIKSYVTSKFTVFACGNKDFISEIKKELSQINLEEKDFRCEIVNTIIEEPQDIITEEVKQEEIEVINETKEQNDVETKIEKTQAEETKEKIPQINEYNIKVFTHENEFNIKCKEDETILSTLEKNNIKAKSKCRNGKCGYCRTLLIWGDIKVDEELDNRRKTDIKNNYIHPCITYPTSDITIKIDI